jgi:cyclophilin family peptidyl-prolyl cis-trans isomerase
VRGFESRRGYHGQNSFVSSRKERTLVSRQRRRRGRLRRGPSLASQAQAKPPFPVSLLFNVRAFYIVALVIMVTAVAAGAIMSQYSRGGGSAPTPTPVPTEEGEDEIPPEDEPVQVSTYDAEPEMTIDPSKQYVAVIETEQGEIRIELFPDKAPQAVNSLVFLARDGFYDGLAFFRVIPGFVAQVGDPTCRQEPGVTCTGTGGPGYTLPLEENDLTHEAGAVAMGAAGGEISGSQFYIAYGDESYLDGRDTVIGKVAEGMDVVESLTEVEMHKPNSPAGDQIISISIEET